MKPPIYPASPITTAEYETLRDKKRFPIELARKLHDALHDERRISAELAKARDQISREHGEASADAARNRAAVRIRGEAMERIDELVSQAAGVSPREEPIPVLLGRVLEILARAGAEAT